jgi:hypothetical protein
MIGKNKSYKSQFVTKNLMVIVCMLILCLAIQLPVDAVSKKKVTMDLTGGGEFCPKIVAAWIAFSMGTGSTEAPYPINTVGFAPNLFVKALYKGEYKLYHMFGALQVNPVDYYTVGYDGPLNPNPIAGFTTFPKLNQSVTLTPSYRWDDATWGVPNIKLVMNNCLCYAFESGVGRKYKFIYDDWSLINLYDLDLNNYIGINRVSAEVSYAGNTVITNKGENALRICIRSSDYSTPNAQRTAYVNWLFAYIHTPYQFGGSWFGGKTSDNLVPQGSYTGYGIDCSGLVSNGAKWAGYNWSTWRQFTFTLSDVSTTTFPENEPFGVGDILNKSHSHVVTVIGLDGNTINIIEAAGDNKSATYEWANRATNASQTRVVIGDELQRDFINKGYVQRRLIPHQ